MNLTDSQAIITLNLIPDIGPIRFQNLLNHFGAPSKIFDSSLEELSSVDGIGEKLARNIKNTSYWLDCLQKELKLAQTINCKIITIQDSEYPQVLKILPDYPPVIYLKGKILPEDFISVAVVGTRRPTFYGRLCAEKISKELVHNGITTVSGLARGIDTIVHQISLSHKGRTLSVLGNGLNRHYPPENRKLEESIVNQGAIISEFPLNYPPDKTNFPRRNRIISGISLATVVVEADEKSGALITAKLAASQGKDVFAIPGSIFSNLSKGPHLLIKQGAKLVETATDIIDDIAPLTELVKIRKKDVVTELIPQLTENEKKIIFNLSYNPQNIDILISKTGFTIQNIFAILTNLEIKGLIKSLPGQNYCLTEKANQFISDNGVFGKCW